MREIWKKLLKHWLITAPVAALVVGWVAMQVLEGAFEGSGWGPKQLTAKYVGDWFTAKPEPSKQKVETGSLPVAPPSSKPEPTAAQKAAARKKTGCEKERSADLLEAEKVLAIRWDRARNCVEEHKIYLLTRNNPEAYCTTQIKAREDAEGQRDAIAGRKC